jgi:hypothetical protein
MTRAAITRFPRNNAPAGRTVAAVLPAGPPIGHRVWLIPLNRPSIIGASALSPPAIPAAVPARIPGPRAANISPILKIPYMS